MNTHKNNNKGLRAWSALCLVALGLTGGTGCDLQGTDSQNAIDAAANPSTAMARGLVELILPRLEKAESTVTAHTIYPVRVREPEKAEMVEITQLR